MTAPGKIAWVEDDSPIINPVVYRLERAGYQIDRYLTYSEAKLAKEIILSSRLILLDLIIRDGADFDASNTQPYLGIKLIDDLDAEAIRTGKRVPPVLIMSAVTRENVIPDFQKKYASRIRIGHLRKPVLPTKLKERVEQMLSQDSDIPRL